MPDSEDAPQVFQDELARIEAAVDGGETDVSKLGFWKLVRQIKADPMLSAHWADQVGRIDRKLFEARVRPKFPVWFGNLVLTLGTVAFLVMPVYAGLLADGWFGSSGPSSGEQTWGGILLLASALGLSASIHDLGHWLVGRVVGIRFIHYFLNGPTKVQPGLKTDYATYLRTAPEARAVMHASGAVASKIAPFLVLLIGAIPVEWDPSAYPAWAVWAVLGFGVLQVITDLTFSAQRSDWARVRRELLVARAQETRKR
jgi:hypothetical protein